MYYDYSLVDENYITKLLSKISCSNQSRQNGGAGASKTGGWWLGGGEGVYNAGAFIFYFFLYVYVNVALLSPTMCGWDKWCHVTNFATTFSVLYTC